MGIAAIHPSYGLIAIRRLPNGEKYLSPKVRVGLARS